MNSQGKRLLIKEKGKVLREYNKSKELGKLIMTLREWEEESEIQKEEIYKEVKKKKDDDTFYDVYDWVS